MNVRRAALSPPVPVARSSDHWSYVDRISRMAASAAISITAFALVATMVSPALPTAARSTAALRPATAPRTPRSSSATPRPKVTRTLARRTSPVAYVVRAGDTLSSIARKQLGSADRWPALWWVNRKRIPNPNEITTADRLSMPGKRLTGAWLLRRARTATAQIIQTVTDISSPPAASSGATHITPSGSAFERCVMNAESGDDPTAWYGHEDGTLPPPGYTGASGLFGDLLSTWQSLGLGYLAGAAFAPVSVQIQGFWKLFREDGMAPWVADPCPAQFGY